MTNEEYLQQYCKQCHDKSLACESSKYCVHCQYRNDVSNALKWKDQQFKEYLKKKQNELDGTRNKSNYELLEEIINELFKEGE